MSIELDQILTMHNLKVVGASLTTIITIAGAFCAMTPTPPANTTWGKIYRLIELLAFNFGKAKMQAPQAPQAPQADTLPTTDSANTVVASTTQEPNK